MSNNDFIEVPEPLFKYQGEDVIHEDNQRILRLHREEQKAVLSNARVKRIRSQLKSDEKFLQKHDADKKIEQYERLLQSYNSHRLQLSQLRATYQETEDSDEKHELSIEGRALKEELSEIEPELNQIIAELKPLRDVIRRRNQLRQKLEYQRAALAEAKERERLERKMHEEAELIADRLSEELAGLNFKYVETLGKKKKVHKVYFDHVVITADQHQLKIAISKSGFAGGTKRLLPNGVNATDILKPDIMRALSMAVERNVWTPHLDEDVNNQNGAWIVVERLGLVEGIPKRVSYRQLMSRYETAEHSSLPIPAGLRRGRRINWVNLDSSIATHIMFTGITGSGKSNTVQACTTALIEKQSPKDVRFVVIDLKNQGDFKEIANAPHTMRFKDSGIIKTIPDIVEVLKQVRSEMHWRQRRIGAVAKNIKDFNQRVREEDRLPRIVVIFDEYANTRRERFKDEASLIDDMCIEITQIGRASGIHLWIGIQQPRKDNMPPALQDNFTTKFIGHQASVGAGMSVSGDRESLKLADFPGRMLAKSGWKSFEVQMPKIVEDDINNAIKIANEAYGNLEPYVLHCDREDDDLPEIVTDQDIVIQTAFEYFDGALKAKRIWEHLKPDLSRNRVFEIVQEIVSSETIIVNDTEYRIEKRRGNYHIMVPVEDSRQVSDVDSP